MARAFCTDVLTDSAGNSIQNALGTLYTDEAATTLVSDAYGVGAGGTLITTVTTDSTGRWKAWFTTPKSFWIRWSDNNDTAFAARNPSALLNWTTFTSAEHQAFQTASDEAADDADMARLATVQTFTGAKTFTGAVAENGAANVGTYAEMVALASPANGRRFYVTAHRTLYRYDASATRWVPLNEEFGYYNVLAYGAVAGAVAAATPATDSWDAFRLAIQAAAQNDAVGGPGVVLVPPGRYKVDDPFVWTTLGLDDAYGRFVRLKGFGGYGHISSFLDFGANEGFYPDAYGRGLSTEDIYMQSSAGRVLRTASSFWAKHRGSVFATTSTTLPAIHLYESFVQDFQNCQISAPANGIGSVLIENIQAWYHRFKSCDFTGRGVVQRIGSTHSTVTGEGIVLEDCFSELFNATPLYEIQGTAAVSTSSKAPSLIRCYHQDATGDCDMLSVTQVAGGTLNVYGGLIEEAEISGSAKHIRTAGAGTVHMVTMRTALGNQALAITHGAASGNMRVSNTSGNYEVRSNQGGGTVVTSRRVADSGARFLSTTDGDQYFGDGTGSTYQVFPAYLDARQPGKAWTLSRDGGEGFGSNTAGTSGQLYLYLSTLQGGQVVNNISFMSGSTSLASGTNQWFCIVNAAGVPVRFTSDDTSASWNVNVVKTLTLTAPYTVPFTGGPFYLGVMVAATTMPTLAGVNNTSTYTAVAPKAAIQSSTGLTTVASCPSPVAMVTAVAPVAWAWVN